MKNENKILPRVKRIIKDPARIGRYLAERMPRQRTKRDAATSAPAAALEWIRRNELPTGGIRVHSRHANAYPEVTGYLIPTLLQYGELALAKRCLDWLKAIQLGSGAFTDANEGVPYIFDTGQALRGLLAGLARDPGLKDPIIRAVDFLIQEMKDGGKSGFGTQYDGKFNGTIPETIFLYVLPPLVEASTVINAPNVRDYANNALEHYIQRSDFLQTSTLTHFLAYQLEALIDLGRKELAMPLLERFSLEQRRDGSIPATNKVKWVCTPGLAQLAICWYKVGMPEPADKALGWLENKQFDNGGFQGSYGWGRTYFPNEELSWANKFYLDANWLRIVAFFDRNVDIFPDTIAREDGRSQAVRSLVTAGDRILEVGCGKGRFLRMLADDLSGLKLHGVDISPAFLAKVPQGIERKLGSLECIPYPDNEFDVTFSVEAIEHSCNMEAAVNEMVRVTRPGGWVLIIDKQQSQWGRMRTPSWERWPEMQQLISLLQKECVDVVASSIDYGDHTAEDSLMVAWRGRKRG